MSEPPLGLSLVPLAQDVKEQPQKLESKVSSWLKSVILAYAVQYSHVLAALSVQKSQKKPMGGPAVLLEPRSHVQPQFRRHELVAEQPVGPTNEREGDLSFSAPNHTHCSVMVSKAPLLNSLTYTYARQFFYSEERSKTREPLRLFVLIMAAGPLSYRKQPPMSTVTPKEASAPAVACFLPHLDTSRSSPAPTGSSPQAPASASPGRASLPRPQVLAALTPFAAPPGHLESSSPSTAAVGSFPSSPTAGTVEGPPPQAGTQSTPTHRLQHYEGKNPQAAAAARFAQGYRALEASQLQNLQALLQSGAALDTAQLQVRWIMG